MVVPERVLATHNKPDVEIWKKRNFPKMIEEAKPYWEKKARLGAKKNDLPKSFGKGLKRLGGAKKTKKACPGGLGMRV